LEGWHLIFLPNLGKGLIVIELSNKKKATTIVAALANNFY
jgi:hypothetical protein